MSTFFQKGRHILVIESEVAIIEGRSKQLRQSSVIRRAEQNLPVLLFSPLQPHRSLACLFGKRSVREEAPDRTGSIAEEDIVNFLP